MARGRKTPTTKAAEALATADILGVDEAVRLSGVSRSTIYELRREPLFAQLRTEKNEDVAADLWAGMQVGFRRVAELFPTSEDISKVAVAAAIMYDKHALMTGQATSRSESRDLDSLATTDDDALAAARSQYLTVLQGPALVGRRNGHGPASNGRAVLSPISVSGGSANGHKPTPTGAEGPSDGDQPNGRDRGSLAG